MNDGAVQNRNSRLKGFTGRGVAALKRASFNKATASTGNSIDTVSMLVRMQSALRAKRCAGWHPAAAARLTRRPLTAMAAQSAADAHESFRLAIVGDVHDVWSEADEAALHHLAATGRLDFVLFVGDFGNENVPLVARVAALRLPHAAILGNHDAWYAPHAAPTIHSQLRALNRPMRRCFRQHCNSSA